MNFPAKSPPKTLNFPVSLTGKIGRDSNFILTKYLLRRERRRHLLACVAGSSQDKSSFSTSASRACSTPESDSELSSLKYGRQWLHFVGVGGCGISALAMLALEQGCEVSGSDLVWSSFMDRLQESGARLYIGHSESNIQIDDRNGKRLPNALIISSAIPHNNVELQHAKSLGVPVYKRDYWLGKLTENRKLIAISGSHGKSTTASMLAYVLKELGDDLTAVVGAEVPQFQAGNIIAGSSETFVLEADEYDNCFLKLSPYMAIVTNLDWEHVDIFPDEEAVRNVFRKFLNQIRKGGHIILCGDSEGAYSLLNRNEEEPISDASRGKMFVSTSEQRDYKYEVTTFGISSSNEWHACSIRQNSDGGSDFTLCHWGNPIAEFSLQMPGIHNVLNSLAVIAATVELIGNERKVCDIIDSLRFHLKNFRGLARRFETIGSVYKCHIIDDYAHHPTEIRAIIQAARQKFQDKALLVVFQPHTYSRLAAMMDDFAIALSGADQVVVTGVYASRESDHCSVGGDKLSAAIVGPPSEYIYSLDIVVNKLLLQICDDSHREVVVLTLGAGDITTVGPKLLDKLRERLHVPNSPLLSSTELLSSSSRIDRLKRWL